MQEHPQDGFGGAIRYQLGLRRFHAPGLHQRSRTHQFELQVVGLSQSLVQICLQLSRLRSMVCLGVGQLLESTCGLSAGFTQGRLRCLSICLSAGLGLFQFGSAVLPQAGIAFLTFIFNRQSPDVVP